ncbi:hypothetical protein MAP00_005050 [Monascus purpureus]|nr:hypothetical protein MAP00_005050 [Monascus purpureus]
MDRASQLSSLSVQLCVQQLSSPSFVAQNLGSSLALTVSYPSRRDRYSSGQFLPCSLHLEDWSPGVLSFAFFFRPRWLFILTVLTPVQCLLRQLICCFACCILFDFRHVF